MEGMVAEEEGRIERAAGEGRRREEEHVHGGVSLLVSSPPPGAEWGEVGTDDS